MRSFRIYPRFYPRVQIDKRRFLPSSPFLGALAYIHERRVGLSVYLDDPEVSINTNHMVRLLGLTFLLGSTKPTNVRVVQALQAHLMSTTMRMDGLLP